MNAYGIDFGSTNSLLSYYDGESVQILPLETDNSKIVRSVIYIHPQKGKFIGKTAIDAYIDDVNRGEPLKLIEHFTGKYIKVPKPGDGFVGMITVPQIIMVESGNRGRLIQGLKSLLTSDFLGTELFGEYHTLEDLLGIILEEMKLRADKLIGKKVDNAVIGRPVRYVGKANEKLALDRMRSVAKKAGLKNIEFELEPIGAALSYSKSSTKNETVLVFDFGGGTLDISIVSNPSGKILGVAGAGIGGDLIDIHIFQNKLLKYFGGSSKFGLHHQHLPRFIVNALQNWYSLSLLKTRDFLETLDRLARQTDDKESMTHLQDLVLYNLGFALYEEIDRVKKQLSVKNQENYKFCRQSININEIFTRIDLQEIIYPLILQIEKCLDDSLAISGIQASQIDKVVMTGGSSLIPQVREILGEKFGYEKLVKYNVFESVVHGLSIKSSQLWP
jgi:hypothetical chaperone protein